MKITGVRIKKISGDTHLKAFASITIDNAFVIHDLKVIEGKHGLFVSMPGKKVGDRFLDSSHPITAESRLLLNDTVLSEYHQVV